MNNEEPEAAVELGAGDGGEGNGIDYPIDGSSSSSSHVDDRPPEGAASIDGGETTSGSGSPGYSSSGLTLPPPPLLRFNDHFSITHPPSSVRFRGSNVRVYDSWKSQLLIESDADAEAPPRQQRQGERSDSNTQARPTYRRQHQEITVKETHTTTFRLRLLRLSYSLVVLFFSGFLFVFCFQILLFLFMGLLTSGGFRSDSAVMPLAFVGTLLSLPLFLYGLSACMVLAASFVRSTWDGYTFLRFISNVDVVTVEWINFVGLLGIPLMTMSIALFVGSEEWWVITSLCWFCCAFVFFLVYASATIYYEISSALDLIRMLDPSYYGPIRSTASSASRWDTVKRAILLSQVHRLCGIKKSFYIVSGDLKPPEGGSYALGNDNIEPVEERMMLYSRMTTMSCCLGFGGKLFTKLDPPKRVYTLDEARDVTPFVTRNTWSLDKMFCAYAQGRVITVISGPVALLPDQMRSSFACAVVGSFLGMLLVAAFLVWLEMTAVFTAILLVFVLLCCCAPNLRVAMSMFKLYRDITDYEPVVDLEPIEPITKPIAEVKEKLEPIGHQVARLDPVRLHNKSPKSRQAIKNDGDAEAGNDDPDGVEIVRDADGVDIVRDDDNANGQQPDKGEGMYRTLEKFRVTRPSDGFCWALVIVDVLLLFLLPLIVLFVINLPIAILFLVVAVITIARQYFNAAAVLEELGSFDMFEDTRSIRHKERRGGELLSEERWKAKARLNQIVTNVTRSRGQNGWFVVFAFVVILLFFLSVTALVTQDDDSHTDFDSNNLLHDFYYNATEDMRYPSCQVRKGLGLPEGTTNSLADYAAISKLAFASVATTQPSLDQWFGPGMAKDEEETVQAFVASYDGHSSGASYKLFTFTAEPDFAVLTIRGSVTAYDWLTDIQLWSAAALSQLLRALLPFGEMWTPILSLLVRVTSVIESTQLKQVSYYKETAAFVRELQKRYREVHVTGHSLGGGIALITGAQTGIPTVGLCAPNSMISRLTYDPPVTEEQLNSQVFNIIPNRDIVPMIDDPGNLYQRIECRGAKNDLFACHSSIRAICEIQTNCGSGPRPVLCECATELGYDPPTPSGNRKFEDVCRKSG